MLTGPYFLVEGGDIQAFADLRGIESQLEAIDVFEGTYDSYFAADGTLLRLTSEGGKWGKVVATEEVLRKDPEQLAEALRGFLLSGLNRNTEPSWLERILRRQARVSAPVLGKDELQEATLPELVEEFVRTQRTF
jgi:hypothetical protein